MTKLAKLTSVLAFSALALAHGTAPVSAGDASTVRVIAPHHGITLTVGGKRAIGYYLAANGGCQLTLHIADAYSDDAVSASEPVRVNMSVPGGASTRVETIGGHSLAFACAPGATTMTVQPVDRLAYASFAK